MPKFEVTFFRREPQLGVATIEARSAEEAKQIAHQVAIRNEFPSEMDWAIDSTRRPTFSVNRVRRAAE